MTELRPGDRQRLLVLAHEATDVEDLHELPRAILPGIKALVGSDSAIWHRIMFGRREEQILAVPHEVMALTWDPEALSTYRRLMHEQPLLVHYAEYGVSGPLAISEVTTTARWHGLAIYDEFYRPRGIEDKLAVLVAAGEGWITALSVDRDRRGFTAREGLLLGTLAPLLRAVQHRAKARGDRLLARRAVEDLMSGAQCAVVAVDRSARIAIAGGDLLDLLRQVFGPITEGGFLPPRLDVLHDGALLPIGPLPLGLRRLPLGEDGLGEVLVVEPRPVRLETTPLPSTAPREDPEPVGQRP